MILGIGTDVVQIPRIEAMLKEHGERFLKRLFTEKEIALAESRSKAGEHMMAATLAKRIAAKEAMVKALGTGFSSGISWQDMEVLTDDSGKPYMLINGKVATLAKGLIPRTGQVPRIDLSLADDYPIAQAFVVLSFG